MWHQQFSTTVDIHGPLQTRGETRYPGGSRNYILYRPECHGDLCGRFYLVYDSKEAEGR